MKSCFLVLALALALGGCDSSPHPDAAPEQLGIAGVIDGRRAVEFLYGPFDARLDAAVWRTKNLVAGSVGDEVLTEGEDALVSIVLAKAAKEGDQERFYLGVTMVPKTGEGEDAFDCETCAPVVGATVFVKRGDRWVVEAHDPFVEKHGFNGNGPGMELVAIGPARNGILVKAAWFNRGNIGSYVSLWTQEEQKIAPRLGVQTGEENGGNCSDDPKEELEPCHEYSAELRFQPGPLADRYDIQVLPSDPDWEYDNDHHHGAMTFRFGGGKYAPVAMAAAAAATVDNKPWSGPLPDSDPVALVGAFMRADAWGLQLSSENWPLVTRFATWADGPGWDASAVVEWAEIASHRESGKRSEITVRMRKIGDLHADGDYMPVLDTSTAGTETRKFILENVGKGDQAHWKIVEPQDGPHIAVDYVLADLLPAWCGKRDCRKTAAYRILRERADACPSSPVPLNRSCRSTNK